MNQIPERFQYSAEGYRKAKAWLQKLDDKGLLEGDALKIYSWANQTRNTGYSIVLVANSIRKKMLIEKGASSEQLQSN